ncbi:MAG: rhodanese-like domain-containing protein [Sulfurovum sp.]|uniref:rhodanese-like domain-containing protein n=1 Tax=Sulfurovum sp. TaxID=1969726 RepID=UPI002867FC09|nr:rhodanese-like domain-containing protein [Sulfurovum sp.]MCO4845142.1 rhodanese-like domain-containing protein [Sulfurovum sp.]
MSNKKILAALGATIAASLCCITPILAVLAGSSTLASSFSWLAPYHNYIVIFTIIVLLYAWYDKLKPSKELECSCDEKQGFFSSKTFLAIVTLFSIVMLSFPQWGDKVFDTAPSAESCATGTCDTNLTKKKELQKKTTLKTFKTTPSCKTKVDYDTSISDKIDIDTLFVSNYMKEEKLHPTACNQVACTGSGIAAVDVMMERAKDTVEEMSPAVLKKMLDEGEEIILLDVREPSSKNKVTIPTDDESYVMTRGNLELKIHKIIDNKESVVITFCRSGFRGLLAAETLKQLGYKHVYNLSAGLKGWARAGYLFMEEDELVNKKESEI